MAIAVSDAAAQAIAAAIREQTATHSALFASFITYLDANFGQIAAIIPGSPAAAQRSQAQSLNDINSIMASMLDQQQKIKASIEVLQSGVASVSSQVAAGVTTMQMATANEIKDSKFQQLTTNAALARAGLPETQVPEATFLQTTEETVTNSLTFKSQIATTNLVEQQISTAIAWTTTTLGNMVSNSFIGEAARKLVGIAKGYLPSIEPKATAVKAATEAATAARKVMLSDATPALPVNGSAGD